MVEIRRAGVEAVVEAPGEYRERLERLSRDAAMGKDPDALTSDEEIEAEVAETHSDGALHLLYRTFAELSDGRRIATGGDSAVLSIGAVAIATSEDAKTDDEAELDEARRWLEAKLSVSIAENAPDPAWGALAGKLGEHGVEVAPSILAQLSHSVEFDREPLRAWIAKELSGGQ